MEYAISIRITFPERISRILKEEKEHFAVAYGSKYKSEPHITVYLNKEYSPERFRELVGGLRELSLKPFEISLLKAKMVAEEERHRNLYSMDVSHKEELRELHSEVLKIAGPEQNISPYDPHITLGAIDFDDPQADLEEVQKNLKQLEGEKITVSTLTVVFDGKADGEDTFKLIEEVSVPLQ